MSFTLILASSALAEPAPAPSACEGEGCIQLDEQTTETMSHHLELPKDLADKYELVGTTEDASCITPPSAQNPPKIHWYDKLNPIWWLGNADDPKAPDWYRPGEPFREQLWYFRNPFHNFTFYVVGVADQADKPDFKRCGNFPKDVFNPGQGWNFAYTQAGAVRLPFVSFWNKNAKIYIGWREKGNLGAKVNISLKGKYDKN